jgi:HAD superfamily hydrolase (TIGR01509 family)
MSAPQGSAAAAAAAGRALHAVFFDMDGLLVDTEHLWNDAEAEVFARLGGGVWTAEDQAHVVGGPMAKAARYLGERAGSDAPHEEIAALLVASMAGRLRAGADYRPGAVGLLDDLVRAGIPCALVSSSPRILVDAVLEHVGADHFAFTLAGDEVVRTKPHPDPYLEAARRMGAEPARCVVLEDSPTGIAAAEAAGCLVVAVPFVVAIEPGPRRHVVESLRALDAALLDRLVATPS